MRSVGTKILAVLAALATMVSAASGQQPQSAMWPEWDPDGQHLYFVAWPDRPGILGREGTVWRCLAEGGAAEQVALIARVARISAGPSGRLVVLHNAALDILQADAMRATRLAGDDTEGSLSPDGNRVALACGGTKEGLYLADIEPAMLPPIRKMRPLVEDAPGTSLPTWSPDGKKIAFVRQFCDGKAWLTPEIWCVGVDGRDPRKLWRLPLGCHAERLCWIADGRRVLASVYGNQSVDIDTSLHVPVGLPSREQYEQGCLALAPDGRGVPVDAMDAYDRKVRGYWDGRRPPFLVHRFRFGPDGKRVPPLRVAVIDVESKSVTSLWPAGNALTHALQAAEHVTVSPDGRRLAFVTVLEERGPRVLCVANIDGSEVRSVAMRGEPWDSAKVAILAVEPRWPVTLHPVGRTLLRLKLRLAVGSTAGPVRLASIRFDRKEPTSRTAACSYVSDGDRVVPGLDPALAGVACGAEGSATVDGLRVEGMPSSLKVVEQDENGALVEVEIATSFDDADMPGWWQVSASVTMKSGLEVKSGPIGWMELRPPVTMPALPR